MLHTSIFWSSLPDFRKPSYGNLIRNFSSCSRTHICENMVILTPIISKSSHFCKDSIFWTIDEMLLIISDYTNLLPVVTFDEIALCLQNEQTGKQSGKHTNTHVFFFQIIQIGNDMRKRMWSSKNAQEWCFSPKDWRWYTRIRASETSSEVDHRKVPVGDNELWLWSPLYIYSGLS